MVTKSYFEIGFIGGAVNSAVGVVHKIASQMDGKFKLVAGCFSRNPHINAHTQKEWEIDPDRVYSHWELMLEREKGKLDAVIILTPTPDHGYMIHRALQMGFPVISEKSLTASVDEARKIKHTLDELHGFLTITYNYTGYPAVRELKEIIQKGMLGKIHQVMVEMPQEGFIKLTPENTPMVPQQWRLRDYEIPTISLDLGIHVYNLINFLIGEDAQEVMAIEKTCGFFNEIIDNINCIAKFSNDIICNIWYSKTAIGYRNGLRMRIFGNKGSAEWYQMNPEEIIISTSTGEKQIISRGNNNSAVLNQLRYNRFKAGHPAGFIEAFANLYDDIFIALTNYMNKSQNEFLTSFTFGIHDALKGLCFLDAIHKSNSEKKWVHVIKE